MYETFDDFLRDVVQRSRETGIAADVLYNRVIEILEEEPGNEEVLELFHAFAE